MPAATLRLRLNRRAVPWAIWGAVAGAHLAALAWGLQAGHAAHRAALWAGASAAEPAGRVVTVLTLIDADRPGTLPAPQVAPSVRAAAAATALTPTPSRPPVPQAASPTVTAGRNDDRPVAGAAPVSGASTHAATAGATVASAASAEVLAPSIASVPPAAASGPTLRPGPALADASAHSAPVARPGNPLPPYPEAAREDGLEGRVRLRLRIDANGQVQAVEWLARSGSNLLDRAARDALRQWRFEPARQGGQPVAGEVVVGLQFRLDGATTWVALAGGAAP